MQDPLKYFRVEAREIVEQLQGALLELERTEAQVAVVARLLRLAHTLKGAARVVKQPEIATAAHGLEDVLVPLRDTSQPVGRAIVEQLLALVDDIARRVANLSAPPQTASASPGEVDEKRGATAPVVEEPMRVGAASLEHVESLMDGVAELGFQLGSVRQAMPVLAECRSLAEQLAERLDPRRSVGWGVHNAVSAQALAGELEARLERLE